MSKQTPPNGKVENGRYHDLFFLAPEPTLITDAAGMIQEANQAAGALLNVRAAELEGTQLRDFIEENYQFLITTLITDFKRAQDVEMDIIPRGKPALNVSLALTTLNDHGDRPSLMRWVLNDITEQRLAMTALDASERRFRAIFNEASMGILLCELDGRIIRANRAFHEMLSLRDRELFNRPLIGLAAEEDQPAVLGAYTHLQVYRTAHPPLELRFLDNQGCPLWISLSMSLLPDDQDRPEYLMALVENISAEKQAAAELAEMRRRLLESGEEERLRLAQELHDGPMQDLYGAVFRISNFLDGTNDTQMQSNMREVQDILKHVAGTLRLVCGELRPPTLANLGLERAIRSHADRVNELHTELAMQLNLTSDNHALPDHTRLALFRIYQQCMANILRHARATKVMVAFHFNEREILLDVWDNGQGFTLPEKWVDLMRNGQFGLAGIAERVQALGGVLMIDTRPGAGTLVHIVAPR